MKKLISIILIICIALTITACGVIKTKMEDAGIGQASTPTQEVARNATPEEIIQTVVTEMMNVLRSQSDSAGLDLSAAFGLPANILTFPQAKLDMAITTHDEDGDTTFNYGQTSFKKGEEGMHGLSFDLDGEIYQAGAYFSGDEMLLKLADASQPIVKYNMPAGSGAALSVLPPMERYQLCITKNDPAAYIGANWVEQITAITTALAESEETVKSDVQTLHVGDQAAEAETHSITLNGEAAAILMEQFVQAWQGDARVTALLSLSDNSLDEDDEDDIIPTPAMTQLAALPFNGSAYCTSATLTLVASVSEKAPAGLQLAYTASAGSMTLDIVSLSLDEGKFIKTALALPDGAAAEVLDISSEKGANTFSLNNTHSICGPQGRGRFVSVLNTEQLDKGNERTSDFSYSLNMDEEGELKEILTSSGSYRHNQNGAEIAAEFNGVLILIDEEETQNIDFSGTLALNEKEGEVTPPQFIEGSGLIAADRAELSSLFTEDDNTVFGQFTSLSPLQQSLLANMLLLNGELYQN